MTEAQAVEVLELLRAIRLSAVIIQIAVVFFVVSNLLYQLFTSKDKP